jgi:hypothetical protein
MYGFYVSRTDHWWCADIQTLDEAGACDGVILGNQGAIERALHQQYSEVKSLMSRHHPIRKTALSSVVVIRTRACSRTILTP